ncbi:hypothetical protein EGW08_013447 [Elysia chlorotica]|uniref:Uncharacterized protein n=1 Tax=Elysia chlorotica TaxID=188477 RepID=A0A3S1BAA8_ELYCH|nr:hypothetical protein EGW08_013447 [Elysia chlorotica]
MKSPALAHHRVFIWIVTLVIVDSCLASPTRTLGDQDRLIDIAEKVDVIDNKLDRLTSEHDEHSLLERIDQKLVRIDQKLETLALVHGTMATVTLEKPDDGPQKPRPESGGGQREFPYFNCVNLLSVERSPTSNGNRFTLKFTKNVEDVSYSYHDGTGQLKREDIASKHFSFSIYLLIFNHFKYILTLLSCAFIIE